MYMRLLTLLMLFATSFAMAACGGRDDDASRSSVTDSTATQSIVTLHEPVLDGGTFVEGFIAAYVVDPSDPQTLAATQYRDTVDLDIEPGRHDLLVLVYPCDVRCVGWDEAMDRIGAREAAETNPGRRMVRRCRTEIDTREHTNLDLTPVLELGPLAELTADGAPCRIEHSLLERE